MKKFVCAFIASVILLSLTSLLSIGASAATTYNDFHYDLTSSHKDVWFADVVYNGEIVGWGYYHYDVGNKILFWQTDEADIETEYQNQKLPRTMGANEGINITVYAYISGDSGSDSQTYSWSDEYYRGGNSLGWISAIAEAKDRYATYLTGYVKITTSSGTNTSHYRVYDTN